MASLIIGEEDGRQMCTHLHTRDRSWRSVDDDHHGGQDTTSTTSPAFEVRLESDLELAQIRAGQDASTTSRPPCIRLEFSLHPVAAARSRCSRASARPATRLTSRRWKTASLLAPSLVQRRTQLRWKKKSGSTRRTAATTRSAASRRSTATAPAYTCG